MFIIEIIGQFIGKFLWHDGVLGVPAIGIITGVTRIRTEVLLLTAAKAARAVDMSKPGNSDPFSSAKLCSTSPDFIDSANDLMTWNERLLMQVEVSFDDMNIGPADCTYVHLDSKLSSGRLGLINLLQDQRRFAHCFLIAQDHRPHRVKKS